MALALVDMVKVVACRLLDAKPLSKPMFEHRQLDI